MTIKNINYSFDDEVVSNFCYSTSKKIISIGFDNYYEDGFSMKIPCILEIKNWKQAKSKLHNEDKFFSLETHLGIFSLIMVLEYDKKRLILSVNTIDDKYLDIVFEEPEINIKKQ